jgi:hypothetical protein
MKTITRRVVLLVAGIILFGTVPAGALTRHVVVVPRVEAFRGYRPFAYGGYWGPWSPYPYGYSYRYYGGTADIRTEVTPKNAEVYIDGYFAGHAGDFDGPFQGLHVTPGGHVISLQLNGFRTLTEDVYVRPDSTFKMKAAMERLSAD